MEKKQTAMQQFLNWHWSEYEKGNRPSHYEIAQWCAKTGLSVEKSNIVEARVTAPLLHALDDKSYRDEAEDYYNQTFSSLT